MLSVLVWLPVIGAVIIGLRPQKSEARKIALGISFGLILWSCWLLFQFSISLSTMQFTEAFQWVPQLGLNYRLGIDGLSLPLVVLSSVLTWVAIYSSKQEIERPRLYYALILLVNAGLAGGFLVQNLLLFAFFYELELVPIYLLIAIWGGTERRGYAAIKFLTYTAVSGFLILSAFLGIGFLAGKEAFSYNPQLIAALPISTQVILLGLILLGFGIKIPLFPLHTWLPDAYAEASPPIAILLGGVLAKLGTYGLVRFGLNLFPEAWHLLAPGLAALGAASAIYGSLVALAQKDIKLMVAYSSIGHMGYILLAIAAATPLSLLGAVLQMVSHGLILAMLFYLVGLIEAKVGTRDLDGLNGLMNPVRGLPLISALLILAGMASAGIPGLVGFIAEFLVLQGSFTPYPIPTLLCVVCSGLTAVYFVILISRTCFGKLDNATSYYPTVLWSERLPAVLLAVLILLFGLQPSWLTHWSETTTTALATQTKIAAANFPGELP